MQRIKLSSNKVIIDNRINELKRNPLVSKYDINELNVNDFYFMINEINNCKNCSGLSSCKNNQSGYVYKYDEDTHNFKNYPCLYKTNFNKQENGNSLIKTKFMPKGILECSLDNFNLTTNERKDAYKYALRFVDEYSHGNFIKGLYLHGRFGVGKTYLISAIAQELGKKGIKSLLIYFPDLCRELKGRMYSDTLESVINELKTVPVLFIDDLGGELLTSWLRDDVMCPIFNYRVNEGLPMFITSNLNVEELFKHFEQTKDEAYNKSGDSFKAGRIMERIKNLVVCKEI